VRLCFPNSKRMLIAVPAIVFTQHYTICFCAALNAGMVSSQNFIEAYRFFVLRPVTDMYMLVCFKYQPNQNLLQQCVETFPIQLKTFPMFCHSQEGERKCLNSSSSCYLKIMTRYS
jgi:hypothetical protein